MAKQRQYFYCSNDFCLGWITGKYRRTIADCGQEFQGKLLCRECFEVGYRLKLGVICSKPKKAQES